MLARTLSRQEAKAFYDRFGAKQDSQAFYEDPAVAELVAYSDFETAQAVFEFGCGTGRFARNLLENHLPASCSYVGVDISSTMVELANTRLEPWHNRAVAVLTAGDMTLDAAEGRVDRVVSNYVLDLLNDADIRGLLGEARRILSPQGGRLCLVSLTGGERFWSRVVTWLWRRVYAVSPKIVGGCRPISLRAYLADDHWQIIHRAVVSSFGVSSEVVVAARL